MVIETRHLFIRESEFADCRLFAEWETSPSVTEFSTIGEGRDYEQVTREYVRRCNEPDKLQFTIVYKESEEAIGRICVGCIDREFDSCDITRIYIAYSDMRRKGYAEEAILALLDYFFTNMNMERITLDYMPGNKPAEALYYKLGFSHEGILRNAAKKEGRYFDLHKMSMLRSEFYEKHGTN
ncbi:MAG: GNAT family N-acetyltransferase [Clostridia bacterium]|nr:GNAT family N-acetyltransferase [Clostridia bacterium]